jgi:hypothetical protein
MWLASAADLFSPTNDVIGRASGLWKPVSKNPMVLAIAVKQLLQTSTFLPSLLELRQAMERVEAKFLMLRHDLWQWLKLLARADRIVLELDQPAWKAQYATVGKDVVSALTVVTADDEEHTKMLDKIFEDKQAVEDAAEEAIEQTVENLRITACTTPPAKQTQKSKTHGAATLAQHIGAADRKACTDREHR